MMKTLTTATLALVLAAGAAIAQTTAPTMPAATPAPAPAATPAPAPVVKADPANDAKFKTADKNANGMLDGAEVTPFTKDLAKIDTNKDSKISRGEFDVAVKAGLIK